jgi:regulator of sigma E protease
MQGALSFIFVLGVLVIIHELGHFLVARAVGIRAEKFSIGFGPVIFGKKIGETEFVVSILPLGGFVKLSGESPEEAKGDKWEFQSKPMWQRTAVVLAGPLMNALLAYILFAAVFLTGQPTLTSKIGKVFEGTPAAAAGILEGDRVLAVDSVPVATWEELLAAVQNGSTNITLRIERGGQEQDVAVGPERKEMRDLTGKKSTRAFLGVAPAQEIIHVKSGFGEAWVLAGKKLWDLTAMIFVSLGLMITGALPFKESMTGPIGIFFMTQQAAQMGVSYLLYFMGSLSVSLFVLNLLPIPVLDGGHLLFMFIEKLKGSPLNERLKERMTQGGMVLLLGLMAFVIVQDITRFSIFESVLKMVKGS